MELDVERMDRCTSCLLGLRLSISSSQEFHKKMTISKLKFDEDLIK